MRRSACILALASILACGGSGGGDAHDASQPDAFDGAADDTGHETAMDTSDPGTEDLSDQNQPPDSPDLEDFIPADTHDADEADASQPELIELPEMKVASPAPDGPKGFVISNDKWNDLLPVNYPSQAAYDQTIEGLVYHFRPWVRFRMPHPGKVRRLFVYTSATGSDGDAVEVRLSTGFPGGHHPCLDEDTGDDMYPVGPAYRMAVSLEPGWRSFDVSGTGHEVGGYDEFFVIFAQQGSARVGLAAPTEKEPGDYDSYGGLIADAPGDQMGCFSTMSQFTDPQDQPLVWLIRAEIEATEVIEQHRFDRPDSGPSLGGHVAFGDFDGDGDDDILSGGALWRNDGEAAFVNVTEAAGLAGLGGETAFGDYDNDGWRDVLAVGSKARLFHNDGDGSFTEVTDQAGVSIDASSQGVAWIDFDADGYLDFFAASYGILADPETPTSDHLFHNDGDGTFTDVTAALGMPTASPGGYHGRGVCVADYDSDGDPDIYVGNYRLNPNQLWKNKGGMSGFTDVAGSAGVKGNWFQGAYGHTIGPSFGDIDNDGLFDLVVPNLAHPRFLASSDPTMVYVNNGDGTFTGFPTPEKGIVYDETHSGSVLFDADNDGDLDLFLTAVYVGRRSYLYENDGSGTFADATYASGIRQFNGWGCAASDIDGDGDLDLVSKGLYVNGSSGGHYLKVWLTGGAKPGTAAGMSNRDAIGAWVEVTTGGVKRVRQVEGGKGTGCQNSRVLHFGLGDSAAVDSLVVHWPSGKKSEVANVAADQLLEITED